MVVHYHRRDAIKMSSETIAIREYLMYGCVVDGSTFCGLSYLDGFPGLNYFSCFNATYMRDAMYLVSKLDNVLEPYRIYGTFGGYISISGMYSMYEAHWGGSPSYTFATYMRDAIIIVSNREMLVPFWLYMFAPYGDYRYTSYGGINGGLNSNDISWLGNVLTTDLDAIFMAVNVITITNMALYSSSMDRDAWTWTHSGINCSYTASLVNPNWNIATIMQYIYM